MTGRLAPGRLVAAMAAAASLGGGVLIARDPKTGLIVVAVLLCAPLALIDVRLALAGTLLLGFLQPSGLLGKVPYVASLALIAIWLGTVPRSRAHLSAMASRHRWLLLGVVVFAVWLGLSISWASAHYEANHAWHDYLSSLGLLLVTATVPRTRSDLRWLIGVFIAGSLLSLGAGLTGSGLSTTATALQTATDSRFSGGAGDPNYLAAGLVAGLVLAAALVVGLRGPLRRLGLVVALALMGLGLAATQSRGGLIALAVALAAGLVLAKGRRSQAVGVGLAVVVAAAAFFVASPAAWHRVTSFDSGGDGRTDLWTVAVRVIKDHPIVGVGLDNFQHVSGSYVNRPGSLSYVSLIVDQPHVAHDVYLQAWAETGIVGLLLLLAVMGACLRAALLAARRFDASHRSDLALLSRALAASLISMFAASVFISNDTDKRMWFLLGLGPAMLAVANREREQSDPA